ncbi:type II toxin-antitoxin system RelE/ParE family toxin [Coxiella burnetii]|uniref:AAA family ATPase n=1 Tax=Coxiella burnetii (strain RSA 493 / Nine Mile phase I) TaxID=227377 RepID=Q83BL3_COXBU|nr:type II toxin-antitoxin system RelE/ParE family toxin [Coxiella burnetii]NP_820474.2 AAA family ATPase [Coxiella burnetii RSA 493]AAO90988.2 AAA family ATPase [Coxiella burnetii RSA 493]ARI66264.1 plasmid maintenance system killer protein [Coxiella burnetii]AZV75224.1 type II toxin-antitoxin system RelE/ParE family toxin [Coxiella burnetii]MCF2093425.1 type II toxin-antitoxin system RelE/ParE family toxin [Coxiella burnetii]MCF2096196.1 type II toxin-antitoxin system RelE/ParE family toxin
MPLTLYIMLDVTRKTVILEVIIKSFKDKYTKYLYKGVSVSKWQAIRKQAERRLQILDSVTSLDDLRSLPSNRFESLRGNRKGQFSIRINKQWRICFKWINNEPTEVEIVDYH